MTFLGLGTCLALTAFLLISLLTSLVVCIVWRQAERDRDGVGSHSRAAGLFLLRILPTTTGAVFAFGVFAPAFYVFEPRGTGEIVGVSLRAMAIATGMLILLGVLRAVASAIATRRLVREWSRDARPTPLCGLSMTAFRIAAPFPVVSVVGIFRPRLFISEQVLDACTPDELAAVVRHECGHVVSFDNFKRLAMKLSVDPLSWMPIGRRMEQQWHAAAEEAADDYSVVRKAPALPAETSALALANALVRVARMVPRGMAPAGAAERPAPLLPAFFWEGQGVERRVRRLLDGSPRPSGAPWIVVARAMALLPLVVAVAALANPAVLRAFHAVLEAVVETLP